MATEQSVLRSVDRECAGRVIEPRNVDNVGADAVSVAEGRADAPLCQVRRSHRGLRAGHVHMGVPQELGRPDRFHGRSSGQSGRPVHGPRAQGGLRALSSLGANEQGAARGLQGRRQQALGTNGRESERLVVPVKRGNRPDGTPWREGGAESRNRWRERWRELRVPEPSQHDCNG